MGSRLKTEIVLVVEALAAACALLGGVRLTWMAMECGWDRLNSLDSCRLPGRWVPAPPPVLATSMLSAAQRLPQAPPLKVEDRASLRWDDALLEGRINAFPEIRKGATIGLRISRLQAGGPIERLGLQNGDVVLAINGHDLTSPGRALDAYN